MIRTVFEVHDQFCGAGGSSKDKVKQLGNAVTPPVMELLIDRCIQTLL